MKFTFSPRYYSFVILSLLCTHVGALDLPVFYRAPLFQAQPKERTADWTTGFSVRYASGSTRTSRNPGQHKSPLLSIYDPLDITKLGLGLQSPGPLTKQYWGQTTSTAQTLGTLGSAGVSGDDGQVDILGKLRVDEVAFTFQQALFSGFFAEVYVPLCWTKIDTISFKNRGTATVNGQNVNNFINNILPNVLKENNFQFDELTGAEKRSGVPEVLISGGWSGFSDKCFNIVQSIAGSMQVGGLIPTGGNKSEDRPFAPPLGYNDFWGVNARLRGEIGVFKYLAVGAGVGATILFREDRIIRLRTDKTQAGWLALEKGRVEVDPGQVWDFSAYVKGGPIAGLSCMVGASYVSQERTLLTLRDGTVLNNVVAYAQRLTIPAETRRFIAKNDIINADERFQAWDHYTINTCLQYDAKAHLGSIYAPQLLFEYSCPVLGKRSFETDMFAGTAGFQIVWDF